MAVCKNCGDVLRMTKLPDSKVTDPKDSGWRRLHSTSVKAAGCRELQASRQQFYYPERQGTWKPGKDGVLEWQSKTST